MKGTKVSIYQWVLLFAYFLLIIGAILFYIMMQCFLLGGITQSVTIGDIPKDIGVCFRFSLPIIIIDFIFYLLWKRKEFRIKSYVKCLVIVLIPLLFSYAWVAYYSAYVHYKGNAFMLMGLP